MVCAMIDESKQAVYREKLIAPERKRSKARSSDYQESVSRKAGTRHRANETKWWENKDWNEIEREIQRQEAEFAREHAREQEEYQLRRQRRSDQRRDAHVEIKKGLAALASKYGLTDDYPDLKHNDKLL